MEEFVNPRLISITIRRKSDWLRNISAFHDKFMDNMFEIPGPLGFAGAERPPTPIFVFDKTGEMSAWKYYSVKGRARGIKFHGSYTLPETEYELGRNPLACPPSTEETWQEVYYRDYSLNYEWKLANKKIDYHYVLHHNLPAILGAFEARFTYMSVCYYGQAYEGGYHGDNDDGIDEGGYSLAINPTYNRLKADPAIDVDGWNNIYTLNPAQFWEGGRCHRALGYGPDEVIRRLSGKVPLVRPLRDGVYIVLNDNPNITYEF